MRIIPTLLLSFVLFSSPVYAGYKKTFNPDTGVGDFVGVSASRDVAVVCDSGFILKSQGSGVWGCDVDSGGAGSGDIDTVGDCVTGACFNGTQGTTLTFNNAGGDATLTYDGADFVLTKPLGIVASSVPSYTSLEIENTSTVDESSAIEILRNVSQTGNVGSFHFGLDSGVHWNLAGFNMTGNMRAVYGGIAPGDNVGGGTFTDLMNFYAYLTGDALEDYDITNHYGLYLAFNNPGIGTISNLYGSRFIPIGTNNGTISNIVGYQIDAVAGASSTKGFVGSISSGSGKYNLYMDGTAINYLAGNTGIGVVPTTKFNIQSTSARYVNFFDVNSTNSHIFRIDDNSAVNLFTLENRDITATTDHGIDIEYQFADNVDTTARAAGTIRLLKEQQWTSTASTRDSYMEFHTALDGVPTKAVKIDSSGNLQVVGRATAQELRMYEATGSGSNYTAFKAQPQAADITYTLPPDDGDAGEQLQTNGSGSLTWEPGGAPATVDYLVGTASSGLSAEIVVGTSPGGELGGTWASPTIDDSLAVTSWNLTTPTITTSATVTDNDWIGLGSSSGLIEFDDQATDEVNILNSYVGIGTSTPQMPLQVSNTTLNPTYSGYYTNTQFQVVGNRDDGSSVIGEIRNTSTSSLAFSALYLSLGTTNEGGFLAAARAATDAYGVVNGLNFSPNSTSQDIGFRVGSTMTGGASGPDMILQGSSANVGMGTGSPSAKLHVNKTTEQLRLSYNSSNYTSFTTSSGGDLTITPSGGDLTVAGTVTSSATGSLGWSIASAANQACTTTCTSAAVFGWDTSSGEVAVSATDATADKCLCAGAS